MDEKFFFPQKKTIENTENTEKEAKKETLLIEEIENYIYSLENEELEKSEKDIYKDAQKEFGFTEEEYPLEVFRKILNKRRGEEKIKSIFFCNDMKEYILSLADDKLKESGTKLYEETKEKFGFTEESYSQAAFIGVLNKIRIKNGIKKESFVFFKKIKEYLLSLTDDKLKESRTKLHEEIKEEFGFKEEEYPPNTFNRLLYNARKIRGIKTEPFIFTQKLKEYLRALSDEELKKSGTKLYEEIEKKCGFKEKKYSTVAFDCILNEIRKEKEIELFPLNKKLRKYLNSLSDEELKKSGTKLYEEASEKTNFIKEGLLLSTFKNTLNKIREEKGTELFSLNKKIRNFLHSLTDEDLKKTVKDLHKMARERLDFAEKDYCFSTFEKLLRKIKLEKKEGRKD